MGQTKKPSQRQEKKSQKVSRSNPSQKAVKIPGQNVNWMSKRLLSTKRVMLVGPYLWLLSSPSSRKKKHYKKNNRKKPQNRKKKNKKKRKKRLLNKKEE